MANKASFEKITTHLQQTGYVYQGSEIYNGLSNTWDYGPLGAEIKRNVRDMWWKRFVQESPTNVGIDAAILMNPRVWEATGHVTTFNDPMIDCKACKARHRADNLIKGQYPDVDVDAMSFEEMDQFIKTHDLKCPVCGKSDFTPIRKFNMMFKTHIGVTDDSSSVVYLRPETAQGVFVNFKNVQRTMRRKVPFGICNAGKSFRNEITPGNFTFRTREFEQLEMEFFCKPGTDLEWFSYWKNYCLKFVESLGIKEENLRYRDHEPAELAFYSKATTDVEYDFPTLGWGEILGVADRTDYDLKRHMEYSKQDLTYLDPETNERYIPYVIEPSMGLDRLILMTLVDSYDEETLEGGTPASSCTFCRLLPHIRSLSSRFLRNSPIRLAKSLPNSTNISAASMTRPVPSVNVIVVRTKSARHIASPLTSTPRTMLPSPSVNATACSKSVCQSMISSNISKRSASID